MRRPVLAAVFFWLLSALPAWADREAMWKEILAKPSTAVAAAFDEKGRLWVVNYEKRHLYARHSDDLGKTMSPPVRINTAPEDMLGDSENRPKLIVRDESLFVSYTAGLTRPMTGDIRFSRSSDGGKTFSEPITVNDNREIISHRFDALTVGADGRVALAWLDKRDIEAAQRNGTQYKGAAVYVAESVDGGLSFAPNRKLADHTCECCRVGLAADRDGMPVAFWRHIFDGGIRDFALARFDEPARRATEDGWKIDGCPHHGGDLSIDSRGARHLAWFTGAPGNPGLFYRRIVGEQMTVAMPFGDLDAQPGHPTVLAQEGNVFLAWREFDGRQMTIKTMTSRDRGDTWSRAAKRAVTAGAADYPLLLAGRGKVWLAWNTASEGFRLFDLETEE
ncbi:MAG: glycoside hydrolase [Sterolibacteriaceae bacterium MAG5]|nr:glycoside hydrolase [Candidatus Nitricoxidireducens bremensis]